MELLNTIFKETNAANKQTRETDLHGSRHSHYPSFCSKLEVAFDEKRRRFVRAVNDIPLGKVVCVDEGVTLTVSHRRCTFCVAELKTNEKGNCARCRVEKRWKAVRACEDGSAELLRNCGMLEFAVRIALSYSAKEIVDELKKKESDARGLPSLAGFSSRQFASVAALERAAVVDIPDVKTTFKKALAQVLENLSRHPEWCKYPDREKLFTDALHFIMKRVPANAHTIFHPDSDPNGTAGNHAILPFVLSEVLWPEGCELSKKAKKEMNSGVPLAVGFFPTASIFNHSCRPNTFSYFHQNRVIYVSRGIRKGDEVTDSYGPLVVTHTLSERTKLFDERGFLCLCVECRFERERVDEQKRMTEQMAADLTPESSFSQVSRVVCHLEKLLPSFSLHLAHLYRHAAVAATREGQFDECIHILERYIKKYSTRLHGFDQNTASTAHAMTLISFANYMRTGRREELLRARRFAFRSLLQYNAIYGPHGILTRNLVQFLRENGALLE